MIDFVAEKLHAHGISKLRRKDIDDTAAHAELSLAVDKLGAHIAGFGKKSGKRLHADRVPDGKRFRRTAQDFLRNRKGKRSAGRRHHHIQPFLNQIRQNRNTLMLQLMGGNDIIKHRIPLRVDGGAQSERRKRSEKARGAFFVRRTDKRRNALFFVTNTSGEESVKRPLAKSRHKRRISSCRVPARLQGFPNFTVFPVFPDTVKQDIHMFGPTPPLNSE